MSNILVLSDKLRKKFEKVHFTNFNIEQYIVDNVILLNSS